MPAKDIHHDLVHGLLVADGWRVTHDPYRIVVGRKNLFVDLGAEKIIAADREGKHIAVLASARARAAIVLGGPWRSVAKCF